MIRTLNPTDSEDLQEILFVLETFGLTIEDVQNYSIVKSSSRRKTSYECLVKLRLVKDLNSDKDS